MTLGATCGGVLVALRTHEQQDRVRFPAEVILVFTIGIHKSLFMTITRALCVTIWFSHRFSILAPKVTPKGPPDGPDPSRLVFEAQPGVVSKFSKFSFSPGIFMHPQLSVSVKVEKVKKSENEEFLSQSNMHISVFCDYFD